MSTLSIIIPVYNSEKYLPELFHCLEKNRYTDGDEILLVDNGSSDNSANLCRDFACGNSKHVRFLSYVEKAGSYSARNFALQNAKGDVFVFTDSDCKPTENWCEKIRQNIGKGTVVAGNVILEIVNKGLWECFDQLASLNNEKSAKNNSVATANMAVFREDFFKVGMFEERFSGGDYDWSKRAFQCGLSIKYVPDAIVYHPTRKTFDAILKKEQRIAYGEGCHSRLNGKSKSMLICKYVLKFFKIDTNVRYTINLKKYGIGWRDLLCFNVKFIRIRYEHLRYAIMGFKKYDVRKLGIK